jgi:hypothetical protein
MGRHSLTAIAFISPINLHGTEGALHNMCNMRLNTQNIDISVQNIFFMKLNRIGYTLHAVEIKLLLFLNKETTLQKADSLQNVCILS